MKAEHFLAILLCVLISVANSAPIIRAQQVSDRKNPDSQQDKRVVVDRGHLFLAGRYVPAPYELELRGNNFLINGLPIHIARGTSNQERIGTLMSRCRLRYFVLKEQRGDQQAQEQVLKELLDRKQVQNTHKRQGTHVGVLEDGTEFPLDFESPFSKSEMQAGFLELLQAKYEDWSKNYGKEVAYSRIAEFLQDRRGQGLVRDFETPGRESVRIKFEGSNTSLPFSLKSFTMGGPSQKPTPRMVAEEIFRTYERRLGHGDLIIRGGTGAEHVISPPVAGEKSERVRSIVDSDLTSKEKEQSLQDVLPSISGRLLTEMAECCAENGKKDNR